MWKRDEAVRAPTAPTSDTPAEALVAQAIRPDHTPKGQNERDSLNIGKSVVIKGELNGSEDLTIEGHVEGKIDLCEHALTIGPNGKIKAQLNAKSVIIFGEVTGNVTASEKVDIRENGSVEGDITAPRVAIAEGAHFRGSVDMQNKSGKPQPAQARAAAAAVDVRPNGQSVQPAAAPGPRAGA
jgi:cytoskeletal protein CcmA (bactofilin family)